MATPASEAKKPKPQRRTQAERRARTRAALLDATIECLNEFGYADTTTNRIVERAGVSRGAQVHHFPTKAELVIEAVRHLSDRRRAELLREAKRLPDEGPDRVRAALDLLWKIHTGPLFGASLELWTAARTDRDLRTALAGFEAEMQSGINEMAIELLGDGKRSRTEVEADAMLVVSTIMATALITNLLETRRGSEAIWTARRERLEALFS
jgi:AcrR family transcriptional regulator